MKYRGKYYGVEISVGYTLFLVKMGVKWNFVIGVGFEVPCQLPRGLTLLQVVSGRTLGSSDMLTGQWSICHCLIKYVHLPQFFS